MNEDTIQKIEDSKILKFYHLIHAGSKNSLELIKIYIKDKQIDINNTDNFFTSPLSFAIFMRQEEIALYLIELGANVRFIDSIGLTPLNYALTWVNHEKAGFTKVEDKELLKVVISLVNKGVNLVHKNPINNMYPYREALIHKYVTSYTIIMNRVKAILFNPDKYPEQSDEINNWMIDKTQFDKCKENSDNLIDACYLNNDELAFKILENNPDSINTLDDLDQNALHYAISNKKYSLIKKLILMGIDCHKKSIADLTPLDIVHTLKKEDESEMILFLKNIFLNKDKLIKEESEKKELEKKKYKLELKKNKENRKKEKKNNFKKELFELENMMKEDTMLLKKQKKEMIKKNIFDDFFFKSELNNKLWTI